MTAFVNIFVSTKAKHMKTTFNLRQLLHKIAAFIEKHSPLKGELVDVEITKINGRVSYTYRKVA
jgi:hypothetical protein